MKDWRWPHYLIAAVMIYCIGYYLWERKYHPERIDWEAQEPWRGDMD